MKNLHSNENVVEGVDIVGRVSAAGAVLAPVVSPRFTVTHTASTGVYNIVFTKLFTQFLGAQLMIEQSAIPGSLATSLDFAYNWNLATKTLQVLIWNNAATPAGTDAGFAFVAKFAESNVP